MILSLRRFICKNTSSQRSFKWRLADGYPSYEYSSPGFYEIGEVGKI